MPGILPSLGRSRAMISSAVGRSWRPTASSMKQVPVLPLADERDHVLHVGIGLDDGVDRLLPRLHRGEGDVLRAPRVIPISEPVSCCGKKPLGMSDEEEDRERERGAA